MRYVGMDVHWRQTTICILDENGRRVKTFNVRGAWQKVLEELGRFEGHWQVCFEASCGYGWLYERLKAMAQKVVLPGIPGIPRGVSLTSGILSVRIRHLMADRHADGSPIGDSG